MPSEPSEIEELQLRLAELERKLEDRRAYIEQLERANKQLQDQIRLADTSETTGVVTSAAEYEEVLKRVLAKVAMILQAEKCVFMVLDKEAGELYASRPALGLTDEEVRRFRVRATQGISGQVFRDGEPVIFNDAVKDERTVKENVALLNVRNGVCVPLTLEKRDPDTNKVIEKKTVGVLHVFNKRYGSMFTEEDTRLLSVLARQASQVIAQTQSYFEVVEEKKQLVSAIESIVSGLITVAKNGHMMQINASARRMFGLNSQEVHGRPFDEIIEDQAVRDLINSCIRDEEEQLAEIAVNMPEERIFQSQTALMHNEDHEIIGAVVVFNDITEIRSIERMKTAFVSTVSHELRTPLTSIKGFISTLLQDHEGYYDTDTQREFYQIIDSECDRLTRLISDLLNVSRIEAGRALDLNLQPVGLRNLIEKVISVQKSYASNHELVTDIADGIDQVVADEDKVDQILTNLVNNAIKYSPNGGKITIKAWPEDERAVISVSDQGMGIPDDHLAKVFDRFHRIDNRDTRKVGGTGIGLFLVKHLVEAHHGDIRVDSEVGVGTTFTFWLPKEGPKEEKGEQKEGPPGPAGRKEPTAVGGQSAKPGPS
jgi:PAS domain S-box-containing protein